MQFNQVYLEVGDWPLLTFHGKLLTKHFFVVNSSTSDGFIQFDLAILQEARFQKISIDQCSLLICVCSLVSFPIKNVDLSRCYINVYQRVY